MASALRRKLGKDWWPSRAVAATRTSRLGCSGSLANAPSFRFPRPPWDAGPVGGGEPPRCERGLWPRRRGCCPPIRGGLPGLGAGVWFGPGHQKRPAPANERRGRRLAEVLLGATIVAHGGRGGIGGALGPALVERLAERLRELLPQDPLPSLLHGGLWCGNLLRSDGRLTGVIDPAIYHGHCEVELAFGTLFGTWGERSFAAYQDRPWSPASLGSVNGSATLIRSWRTPGSSTAAPRPTWRRASARFLWGLSPGSELTAGSCRL